MRQQLPELRGANDDSVLALADYFEKIPERFFDRAAYSEYFAWLSGQHGGSGIAQILRDERARLDRAYRSLAEINSQTWHDESLGPAADQLRFFDRHAHPAYLQLVEGPLNAFLLLAAWVSRLQRGKSTEGLDLYNVVEEVKAALPRATTFYNHIVRNGIAHGGVSYFDDKIVYTARGQTTELYRQQVVPLVDSLVDVSNALALALKVFLLSGGLPRADWPQDVLLQELQAATANPWWQVRACLPSYSAKGAQLNIHVDVATSDYRKAYFSAVQTAAFAARFVPGYDRYFLSFRSSMAMPGWAGFDGKRLAQILHGSSHSPADYESALEEGLVFYAPKTRLPKVFSSADNLRVAFQLQMPAIRDEFWSKLGRCLVDVRLVERHNDPLLVTKAWVVVRDPALSLIRGGVRGIISQVHGSDGSLLRLLPEGFSHVSVFAKDFRRRRLRSFGLGPELVCTLTRARDPRKKTVDIFGSRVEVVHGVRIAWNTNWPGLGSHLAPHAG